MSKKISFKHHLTKIIKAINGQETKIKLVFTKLLRFINYN